MTTYPVSVALALTALLAAGSSGAQPSPADTWIDEGIRLRAERRDEEALALFRRALEASQKPEARAQVALAEQALGRWVAAERDLLMALTSTDDPWIARNRVHLDAALAEMRQHLGTLEVRSRTPHARVRIDAGEEVSLPLAAPLRVEVGTVRVGVSAEGHVSVQRVLDVRPGDDLLETFDLAEIDAHPEAAATGLPTSALRVVVSEPHPARVWATGLLVGGGVALLGGAAAIVWREVSAANFNADRVPRCTVDNAMPDVVYGGSRCESLRSQTDTAGPLAITGFVAAGVFAGVGLVLFLTTPRTQRRAVAACAPGLLSVSCGVTF